MNIIKTKINQEKNHDEPRHDLDKTEITQDKAGQNHTKLES